MNSTTTSPAPASPALTAPAAERLHVDHGVTKRLGHWTSASQFDVRVRSGVLVLDLRSPEVTGDVELCLDLHRSTVKLLLAEATRWITGASAGPAAAGSRTTSGPRSRAPGMGSAGPAVRVRGEQRGPGAPRWRGRPVGHVLPRVRPGAAPGPQERQVPDRGRLYAGSSPA